LNIGQCVHFARRVRGRVFGKHEKEIWTGAGGGLL
jgi:hypothetical protein